MYFRSKDDYTLDDIHLSTECQLNLNDVNLCVCVFLVADACASVETVEAVKDPLLELISLQKASGCWEMDSALVDVFGKTEKEVVKETPAQVSDVLNMRSVSAKLAS